MKVASVCRKENIWAMLHRSFGLIGVHIDRTKCGLMTSIGMLVEISIFWMTTFPMMLVQNT